STPASANAMPNADLTKQVPDPSSESDLNPELASNLTSLYKPSSTAANAYEGAAASMPQLSSFIPSRLRKVGAFLAGLGSGHPAGMWGGQPVGYVGNPDAAMKTSQDALLAPYDTAVMAKENELKPLQAAANMEMEQNNQARMSAALGVRTNQGQQRIDQGQQRIDLTEQANAIRQKFYHDRGSSIQHDANGNAVMLFSDGTHQVLNGIMSPMQVKQVEAQRNYDLQLRNEVAVAKQKGNVDLANRMAELQKQYENTLGIFNAEEPVKIAGQQTVKQTPGPATESTSTTAVTDASGNPVGTRTTTTKKTPVSSPKTGGPINMIGPDGNTYAINPENVSKALASGYRIGGK